MSIHPRTTTRRPRPSLKTWRSSAPTIHEVARRAHVSSATVSRVLSGTKFVSGELAERVWNAVRELDYRPNHVARNLRARATSTIGVVIPDIQNPFFTSLVRGIEDALQAQKFTLLLANSDGDSARERVCLDTLCAEEVAGLLVVPCNAEPGAYDHLAKQGVPVVAVDRSPAGLNVDLVGVTNEEGARAAVLHLARLGWERIALVGGPLSTNVAVEREQGYRRALEEAGLAFAPSLVERADFREEGGYQAMANLLHVTPRPTAVFVANNLMAMGALRAISDASLRVPDDIALVLFDDIPWGARAQPPADRGGAADLRSRRLGRAHHARSHSRAASPRAPRGVADDAHRARLVRGGAARPHPIHYVTHHRSAGLKPRLHKRGDTRHAQIPDTGDGRRADGRRRGRRVGPVGRSASLVACRPGGQDPRRLGGADDRRVLRRAHRVPSNGKIIEGNLEGYLLDARAARERHRPGRPLRRDDVRRGAWTRVGLDATTEQYGEMFKDSKYKLWHANAAARRLLNHGIKAPHVRPPRSTTSTPTTSTSRSSRTSSA